MEERRGYVSHIVYRNVENGYTVFELENPDEDVEETCVGNVPFLNEGEYVCVRGELVTHPIYQEQLKVMSCEVQEPDDELAMLRYLSSGAIAGVPGYSLSGETYKGEGFEDEMLILKGFTGGMLDSFLHGFRKMKIQPVALKAVLTEANCGWNSLELHDELVKEHESMHSQTPSEVTDNKETE